MTHSLVLQVLNLEYQTNKQIEILLKAYLWTSEQIDFSKILDEYTLPRNVTYAIFPSAQIGLIHIKQSTYQTVQACKCLEYSQLVGFCSKCGRIHLHLYVGTIEYAE